MPRHVIRFSALFAVSMLIMSTVAGCGSGRDVPSEMTIELPDGTETQVTMGSGVISLADTTWEFFRTAANAQGAAFVTVVFGPNGNLAAFENNTIASEFLGDTIVFDGARHNTSQPGLQYAAATYGAETADASGFTFEGRFSAFAAGLEAANGSASTVATFDDDNRDVVHGMFSFSTRVTLIDIPNGNQDAEFSFVGYLVTGE